MNQIIMHINYCEAGFNKFVKKRLQKRLALTAR